MHICVHVCTYLYIVIYIYTKCKQPLNKEDIEGFYNVDQALQRKKQQTILVAREVSSELNFRVWGVRV